MAENDHPYVTARPGRFAAEIRTASPDGCAIALLGLPDDTGVGLNHGRLGARDGPAAFRRALARYGTNYHGPTRSDLASVGVFDAGDVQPRSSLDHTHDAVTRRVAELLDLGLTPVCIGGGHDLTWPVVRAVAANHPNIVGLYYDAHLDVRGEPGSGMPFRKIRLETTCRELHVVGLDPFANSREHVEWFRTHGGFMHETTPELVHGEHLFVSFDLDAVSSAEAPGVSAVNPVGLSARQADEAAFRAGADGRVRSFDIMELNPTYDADGRTARLAARLFLSFVAGFSTRSGA